MSLPWLSDDYKRASKSRSNSPEPEKKKTKVDEFGRTVPVRSRSRTRSRSRSPRRSRERQRRSLDRGRGHSFRGSYRPNYPRVRRDRRDDSADRRRRKRSGSNSSNSSAGSTDNVRPAASTKLKFTSARVFVANLNAKEVRKDELVKHFEKYGPVADLLIHPKNYAFVQFLKEEEARLAVEGENGGTFQGSRLDVKMAMEGKRESRFVGGPRGRGRGRGRGREGFDRERERDYSEPREERDDDFRPRGRRRPHPPYPDEFGGMRDPYFPPSDPYLRGYSDPWLPPPDDPYRMDPYADPYRDSFGARAAPAPPAKVECQIYVVSAKLRAYGEAIEDLVKEHCIITAVMVMPEGRTATDMLTDFSERDGLFAIFVNAQNESHRSLTLNILHGTPQEHRNMPMKDAVALIGRSFEEYVDRLREQKAKEAAATSSASHSASSSTANPAAASAPQVSRVFLPPSSEVTYLLNLLADNRALSVDELEDVIKYLKERRSKLIDAESRPLVSDETSVALPAKSQEISNQAPTEDITSKILSIISGTGGALPGIFPPASSSSTIQQPQSQQQYQAPQPAPPSSKPAAPSMPATAPRPSAAGSNMINFDNPNVQKALDNLIQSSPVLMKTFGPSSSSSVSQAAPEPPPEVPSIESVSRLVGRSSMVGYGQAGGAQGRRPGSGASAMGQGGYPSGADYGNSMNQQTHTSSYNNKQQQHY